MIVKVKAEHYHSNICRLRREGDVIELSKEEIKAIKDDKLEDLYTLEDGSPAFGPKTKPAAAPAPKSTKE